MQNGDKYVWKWDKSYVYILGDKEEKPRDGRESWNCKVYNLNTVSGKYYPRRGRIGTSAGGGVYSENETVFEDILTDFCELDNNVEIEDEPFDTFIFQTQNSPISFQSGGNVELTQKLPINFQTQNSDLKIKLWDAVNKYVEICGGNAELNKTQDIKKREELMIAIENIISK